MIKQAFDRGPLFIPFIMAGHPTLEMSLEAIIVLIESGCQLIELGVPFSDPIADGPINQKAAEIALKQNVNLRKVLNMIKTLRQRGYDTPIILFSYLNPILAMGIDTFAEQAKQAGVNGILIVDLPAEEGQLIYTKLGEILEIILLSSPTTDPERLKWYRQMQPALVYHISRCGITGMQDALRDSLEKEVFNLRDHLDPNQKVVVGFGISQPAQAKEVVRFADGVVVGSKLVQVLQQEGLSELGKIAQQFSMHIME